MIGIPYARREFEGSKFFARCPVCQERIELKVRKDFESFTCDEYAAHYYREHTPEGEPPPPPPEYTGPPRRLFAPKRRP